MTVPICAGQLTLGFAASHPDSQELQLDLQMVLMGLTGVDVPGAGRKSSGTFLEKCEPVFAEKLLPGELEGGQWDESR